MSFADNAFKALAPSSSNRSSNVLAPAVGVVVESLESRSLMAFSAFNLSGSLLTVTGSTSSKNTFRSWNNSNGTISVQLNSTIKNYSKASVKTLKLVGGSLADLFSVASITVPASIDCGGGNDTVYSGSGNDTIAGGAGNDSIIAGGGNDVLSGGEGNDTISAGSGNDSLKGDAGNDRLVGESGRDSLDGAAGTDSADGGSDFDVQANSETKANIEGTIGASTGGSTGSDNGGGSTGGGGIITDGIPTDANAPKPSPKITALETTINAGQSIFVHGTNSSLGAGSAITARFEWDFGDASGKYNKLVGFNAAHTYTNPGTYTIKLRVINELRGAAETSITVNVQSASRRAIYVSNDGNDSNSGSSSGSAVRSWSRAASLVKGQSNVEVLFNRGDTFEVKSLMSVHGENVKIASYGSGNDPILKYAGSRNQGQFIRLEFSARDSVVEGLTFDSIWNTPEFNHAGMPFAVKVDGNYNSIRDCTFLNIATAVQTNEHPVGVLVQDCDAPSTYALRDYLLWGQGSDFVLLGNTVKNVVNEHAVRIFGVDRLLIAYGDYANAQYASYEPSKNALNLQEANYVEIFGVTVRNNWQVGPLGDGDGLPWKSARLNNVVIENCRTVGVRLRVVHGAQNVMIRNNILQNDGDSIINVDAYNASYGRGVSNLNIVNNTGINNSSKGRFLYVGGQASGISLVNNLYKADSLLVGEYTASGVYINAGGFSSFRTISNNIWPSPSVSPWIKLNAQGGTGIHIVGSNIISNYYNIDEWNNSSNVNTDYQSDVSLSSSFAPSGSSIAAGNGAKYAGIFTDFYGNARPLNSAWSVGAVEV